MKTHPKAVSEEFIPVLQARFAKHPKRHKDIDWANVQGKLEVNTAKLQSLYQMEATGGEPDVIGQDPKSGEYLFCDCSSESPAGRRSVCYDLAALESRKENRPQSSAIDMATATGVDILTEDEYRDLQKLGEFDTKTSSWIKTPPDVRKLGGALFCDRRYGKVFVYHNGAQSYYAARGFALYCEFERHGATTQQVHGSAGEDGSSDPRNPIPGSARQLSTLPRLQFVEQVRHSGCVAPQVFE